MRYYPDKMFFSVGEITEDGKIYSDLLYNVLIKNSREVWFLTDRTKIVDRLTTASCDFSALTGVISDFDFSKETKERYPDVTFISADEHAPASET